MNPDARDASRSWSDQVVGVAAMQGRGAGDFPKQEREEVGFWSFFFSCLLTASARSGRGRMEMGRDGPRLKHQEVHQRFGQQSWFVRDLVSGALIWRVGRYFWTVQASQTGSFVLKTTWSLGRFAVSCGKKEEFLSRVLSWRFACAEPRNRSPTNEHPHSSPFFALRFQAASASGLSLDRTPLSVFAPLHPTAADSLPPWTSLAPFSPSPPPITGHSSHRGPLDPLSRAADMDRPAPRKRCEARPREADLD